MTAAPQPADYTAIDALNWSTLKHLAVSPKLLRWRVDHPRPDSAAFRLGRAIHSAVLEPERFAVDFVAEPDFGDLRTNTGKAKRAEWLAELAPGAVARPYFDARTKAGKAARADFLASLSPDVQVIHGDEDAAEVLDGVTVLTADEHALAVRCAEAVQAHPIAASMLRGGRTEENVTWTDPATGIACKGRLDFIGPTSVRDLKSSRRESVRQIAADCARYLYHGQLAWYHDGAIAAGLIPADAPPPGIVVVQTVEPFDVVPATLSHVDLMKGRALKRDLLHRYVGCQAAEWWPGMAPDLIELELPHWAPGSLDEREGDDW